MKDIIPVNLNKCSVSKTAATFDESLTYEEWAAAGGQLALVHGCCMWWIGDWLLFGVKQWGDRSKVAIENSDALGYAAPTLLFAMQVSREFDLSLRREKLSWSHHKEVCGLCKKDQDKFLKEALEKELSVAELRKLIRRSMCIEDGTKSDGPKLNSVANKIDDVSEFLKSQPGDWWDDERKNSWRRWLKPIVDFYNNNLA